jgi:predicted kinase
MKHIIICVGISGSGKSTWSENFMALNPSFLRINRDDIRRVLVKNLVGYYNSKRVSYVEPIVNTIEYDMFLRLSAKEADIIIDNTNLTRDYIKNWIKISEFNNYDIKFKLFDSKVKDAKCRVLNRDYKELVEDLDSPMSIRPTLENLEYIDNQYNQYKEISKWILENFKDKVI